MILNRENLVEEFDRYVREWKRLEREYYQLPGWRWIKQFRNIQQREKLTNDYTKALQNSGLIGTENK